MNLRVGEVAPVTVELTITTEDPDLDLTTVSAASLLVQKPDGTEVTWTAVLGASTATSLALSYELATPSEIDASGSWSLLPLLTVPDGTIDADALLFRVKGRFEP